MAEEKHEQLHELIEPNIDDMSVLNYLLENIRGISLVSGSPLDLVPIDDGSDLAFQLDPSIQAQF